MPNLPALMSQALVAFTIEADNLAEHRMPHRTTSFGASGKAEYEPWLTSMAMYLNSLKYLKPEGMTVRELQDSARTFTNLAGMRRWGYLKIEPYPQGKLAGMPKPNAVVTAKRAGMQAQDAWPQIIQDVETRWSERIGVEAICELRGALIEVAKYTNPDLPDCMPILGYGLATRLGNLAKVRPFVKEPLHGVDNLALPILLAKVLVAFALDVEAQSPISMALGSNMFRVLGPAKIRDLPRLSAVSKESVAMAITFATRRGLAVQSVVGKDKILTLSDKGEKAKAAFGEAVAEILGGWRSRSGAKVERLEAALGALSEDSLLEGTAPYPDCWRAKVPRPVLLPHFPMVLHRGGYPDGS